MVARLWKSSWRKRRIIMSKRRVSNEYMAAWFAAPACQLSRLEIARKLNIQRVGAHD